MAIIDVLTQNEQVGVDQFATFTVNVAFNFVPLVIPAGDTGIMENAQGFSWLIYKEHFNLISIGFVLPLGFEIFNVLTGAADPVLPSLNLRFKQNGGVSAQLQPGKLYIPFGSYELNMGTFYNMNSTLSPVLTSSYQLLFNFDATRTVNISMVGVPAMLNGMTFSAPVFAKIEHTNAMELVP